MRNNLGFAWVGAGIALVALASSATIVLAQQRPASAPAAAGTTGTVQPAARASSSAERNVLIDRVVAVVNDEALTQYDINEQTRNVLAQMKAQKVTPPAPDVLEKQL